ncbi:MAG: polysaccharide deacetylase family protein [Pirellulaceae bacterium]
MRESHMNYGKRGGGTLLCLAMALLVLMVRQPVWSAEFPPDKVVVLTFDDSVRSQYEIVRPILLKYGFGATFFITEGFEFTSDKTNYMTWEQIKQLHADGFEIGNHTRDHVGLTEQNYVEQLNAINQQCERFGIPKPVSLAYPGNKFSVEMFEKLRNHGIQFARRGGSPEYPYENGRGVAFEPGFDHPLLIPSAGDARPDWEMDDFLKGVHQAKDGHVAVLQFHGVPDNAHNWVSTASDRFEQFMGYLAREDYTVIALRDLRKYVDPGMVPLSPLDVVQDRISAMKSGRSRIASREPESKKDLRFWIAIMQRHGYTVDEMRFATGLDEERIRKTMDRTSVRYTPGKLELLPYPGGRHPRIGFRDGEFRPQRETKLSLFTPWDPTSYVVIDVPEAIWHQRGTGRQLLFLAHEDIPTRWDLEGKTVEQNEWQLVDGGNYRMEKQLPNGVVIIVEAWVEQNGVRMRLTLVNESDETLAGLVVQNCVMLGEAGGFNLQTNENKVYTNPVAAVGNETNTRWILTAWQRCVRPWGNEHCPCLHSDPQFPDCEPGKTVTLNGWVSFYEGTDIDTEMKRIAKMGWLSQGK